MSSIRKMINEEIQNLLNENKGYMELKDLAEIISRLGLDFDAMLSIFTDAFRDGGDEKVKETFKSFTGGASEINNIGKGRYVFK
jgi:hypothetical protein